ncbi:LytR family transcriptional regulator [Staphylococcus succinus]|uniref:LCP family protein n=2 Tax=Staphylococcus succinus TaxID=61015 RepID=UPI00093764BF|nr:LCP family protein [Staphylococcus succinus]MEB8126162.1 LCP family protein [Staphylococcus succinus]MEB8209795.1 LCP family protein [Staphylococcus succinus]PTI39281.1 LytR family transcriptional regulator [Staphylococcus succinus]PTJ14205.1 LytR family transcriptional regulator [Staphylococcus succinus]RIN32600.1 LytR family transcriptional regulator [Staphylococcus succinus]
MNKFFKYFLIFLSLLLVVVPVIFAFTLLKSSQGAFEHSFNDSDSSRQSNIRDSKVDPSKDPVSILFLGIDDNSGREKNGQSTEQSRTDAMILSTFNTNKDQIRMLSIPRDTVSYIPKVGYYDKITHAHAFGGPTASMDAVEATLNVPVDYYVRINMEAFVDAVNELGGIKYDVPYNISEPNTNDTGQIKVKKGYQKLNGDEALAVARTRHHDSDLKRGQRQMELIKILFAKAQKLDSFNKLDDVISIVGKNSKHNFNSKEVKALATSYLQNDVKIKSKQLKGEDDYLNGVYYYNPDIKSIQDTSNILRKDLDLPTINDKDDFLNQRVTDFYGTLIPQTELDSSLLRKTQNDSSDDEDNDQNESTDESQDNSSMNTNDSNQQQNDDQTMPQQNDSNQQQNNDQNYEQQNNNQNQQQMDPNQQQMDPNQQQNTGEVPTNQY